MGVNLIKKNCCNKNVTIYKSTDFVVENKNKSILKSSKAKNINDNNNDNNENSPKIKSINISQLSEQNKKNHVNILSSPHKRRNRKILNYSVKVSNLIKFDLDSKKNFFNTIESNNSAKIINNNNENNTFKGRNRKRGQTAKELKTISMEELLKKKKRLITNFLINDDLTNYNLNKNTNYKELDRKLGYKNRHKTSQKFHSIKSIKNSNINSSQKETTNNSLDKISEKEEMPQNQNCEIQRIKIKKHYKMNDYLTTNQETFIHEVLIDNHIVDDFDDETINEFVIGFFSFEIDDNYEIYKEDDEAKIFYIIEEGEIRLFNNKNFLEQNSNNNLPQIISSPSITLDNNNNNRNSINSNNNYNMNTINNEIILKKEDFFGIESFEENTFRTCNAVSKGKTKLLGVSGEFYRSALSYMNLKTINERIEVLKQIFIFKYLEKGKQIELCKILTYNEYPQNSIIINENQICDRIYFIISGEVHQTKKFKKIRNLKENETFCDINFFISIPSCYTFSVSNKNTLKVYEIEYNYIKQVLGHECLKVILYEIFCHSIILSNLSEIMIAEKDELFEIFRINYYENNKVVFPKQSNKNKKICVVISGKLINEKNKNVLAKKENVFGEDIINNKENLEANIISEEESLLLEASWKEIIKANEKNYNSQNKLDLIETVNNLKKIKIFSTLRETKYLEIAKCVSKITFTNNNIILTEGKIAEKFFIIIKGKVKVEKNNNFIRILESGNCFGEIPHLTGEIYQFTYTSIGLTECYLLSSEDFNYLDYNISNQIKQLSSLNDINIELNQLYYVNILGTGRFGKVYLVHNLKNTYAIKYSPIKDILHNKNLMKYFLNEKNILLKIDHPFVVKLVKTLKNEENLFFLMEFIEGITLKTFLDKKKRSELKRMDEATFYGGILLCIINYLHSKRILHRDIKPDNCMIDKSGYLKLIDFGIAKELKDKDVTQTICGTPHYLAPEVIMGQGYSFSSDYWSVGITIFEIFYGYVPFGQNCNEIVDIYYQILNKKLQLPYEPKFNNINSFFKIILSKNLMQRVCNFNLLKTHNFFQDFDFEQLLSFNINPPFIPKVNKNIDANIIQECNEPILNYIQAQSNEKNEYKININYSNKHEEEISNEFKDDNLNSVKQFIDEF